MKRVVFFISFIFSTTFTYAQNDFAFSYDAAGNRVQRVLVLSSNKTTSINQIVLSDYTIYPNPTLDILNIEFNAKTVEGNYKVLSISGVEVMRGTLTPTNRIDMSSLETGTYILIVDSSTLREEKWKIIKE